MDCIAALLKMDRTPVLDKKEIHEPGRQNRCASANAGNLSR